MQILKNIYENILGEMNSVYSEMGGIIGGIDDCVTHYYVDKRPSGNMHCLYAPDVCKFNELIRLWQERNITFMGIFHSHFHNVGTLSRADLEYIEKIMLAMPEMIDFLYFPIVVFPKREIVLYKAGLVDSKLCITKGKILIGGTKNEEEN